MSDLKLTPTHDLDLTNSSPSIIGGREAIAQHLNCRLRFIQGEWFRDLRAGVPYFDRILIRGYNDADVLQLIRAEIAETPGITGIRTLEIDVDPETRKVTITGSATSIDGDIDFTEEF